MYLGYVRSVQSKHLDSMPVKHHVSEDFVLNTIALQQSRDSYGRTPLKSEHTHVIIKPLHFPSFSSRRLLQKEYPPFWGLVHPSRGYIIISSVSFIISSIDINHTLSVFRFLDIKGPFLFLRCTTWSACWRWASPYRFLRSL